MVLKILIEVIGFDIGFDIMNNKVRLLWAILYLVSGIMLAFLLWDMETGKAYIYNGTTLPHWSYIVVLVVLAKEIYEQMNELVT